MTTRQQRWDNIITLFRLIFYAFFQPTRLTREFQPTSRWQRFKVMLRLIIPMFLIAYPFMLVINVILLLFGLFRYLDVMSFLLISIFDITVGIVGGIVVGITGNIAGGIAVGIAGGIAVGIAGGIAVGIAGGIAGDIIALGTAGGIALGIASGIESGIAGGIVGGIAVGITGNIAGGIVCGIAFGIGSILGTYRVPFYIVSGPSALRAYFLSHKRRHNILGLLSHSSLHWDERGYLPLPFLKQTLLLAYDEDPQGTLAEIAFIAAERPQQLQAARLAALEIVMRDIEGRETIQQIAGTAQRLNEILPPEAKLSDPRWANALPRLSNASREAMRSMQPIGRQARLKSLDHMIEELNKIRPNIAFRDQSMNRRLQLVLKTWLVTAKTEHERLEHAAQDIGNIDNPYKPGQVLEPHDPLFVGRRDLAQQLEYELSKGSKRPTLLLQGERRMGKTSTLRQLSYLLGPRYIPVLYNLQDPKIYARTSTFLGTLASGAYEELLKRGMQVNPMSFARLLEAGNMSDPRAYAAFDRWLKEVESVLEAEGCSLLLAFDEFEKLDEISGKGYLDLPLFLDWCRQVIQYRPRIILLFSGVHTFSAMGTQTGLNWSNYFVNVQTLKVSFLKREEGQDLILHPRPDYAGEQIFGNVVEQIIQQTNCHPFLVQALCSQLIDTLNTEKGEQIELSNVTPAVEQLIESWDGYFDDLWKRCDEPQRACLLALEAQQRATLHNIQQHSQLDEKSVQKALRALTRRDLVIYNDDQTYSMAAPIFSRWVKYNA